MNNTEISKQNITYLKQAVFFNKLASFGIKPASEQEANALLTLGTEYLTKAPRSSDQAYQIKSASFENLQGVSEIQDDGFSEETHEIVESICSKNPEIIKSAEYLLASVNQ